jgi:hypothetical protein
MADIEKSPNWDTKNQLKGRFVKEGFPFQEGFPRYPLGATFTLITRDGKEHKHAIVNLDRQYSAEGPQWQTSGGKIIYDSVVVCWIQEERKPQTTS